MANTSPPRSRKALQSKQQIESSNNNDDMLPNNEPVSFKEDSDSSPTRATERLSQAKLSSSMEAQIDDDLANTTLDSKKGTRPRRSIRASRRSPVAIATDGVQITPTAATSKLPEPLIVPQPALMVKTTPEPAQAKSPLCDITHSAINEQLLPAALPKRSSPQPVAIEGRPVFERPMDIVIRTRAKVAPETQASAHPKPRMVITYLVLTNFKSYAGRQEVGPFHASFSSVVGPNGSGKSNVIDSLLFVFGFRASKMRQGKISALIHNSATFPDLPFCEVEVRFQEVIDLPEGKTHVTPDSQILISRRAFKNNSSKYYINGSESNFSSVTTLLRNRGVDLDHKRFLILQGEVESIAQMKPKAATEHDDGLLEYLEDIIGTSKYKTPIDESAAETETLNELCVEKSNRVAHVEKEKKSLEGRKDAALAYIKNENTLTSKQSALYQIYVRECDDNMQVTAEAIEQIQGQLDEESKRYTISEHEIMALRNDYGENLMQFEGLEQSTQMALKQIVKADKEAVKFDERRKHANAKVKKLERTVALGQTKISEASAHLGRLADDLARNLEDVESLEARMNQEESQLLSIRNTLSGKTEGLSADIHEKQKLLEPWVKQISDWESTIAVAQSELGILQEKDHASTKTIEDAQIRLSTYRDDRETKAAEIVAYQQQQTALEGHWKQLRSSLEELTQAEPEKRSRLLTARQNADEARANLSKTQTQGNVLNGLMRLRDSGRITGFHGRLGDLGTIDAKYDIAISTACPALDNLVVDSVEIGQQCIEHLRKNNLGRANFILLDRLSQRDLPLIETPENVPRLFDLVRAKDGRYLPAFYNVLQNTLVATDLQLANRIAYGTKRWRVVTLDGQIIDKSGTMTGGGIRTSKGAMSSKIVQDVSKLQVDELQSRQAELEQQFLDFQQKRQSAEKSLRQVGEDIPALATQIQRSTLELESLERTVLDAERRCSELNSTKGTLSINTDRTTFLKKSINNAEREIEKLSSNASGIQSDIQALQDKIMEVGGVRLRGQKAKVDNLKSQIHALTEEISNAEVEKVKTQKAKVKDETLVKEALCDLEAVATEMDKLEIEAQCHGKDASGSKELVEMAQASLVTKREVLESMKAALDEKTVQITTARGVELETRNQLEEHQKVLGENQKRLKYWQEKNSKLSIHNISDTGAQLAQEDDLPVYTREELADLDKNRLKGEIAILEEKTQSDNIELAVLAEYHRRVEEHATRRIDLAEAVAARDASKKRCEELRRLRLEGFMEGFGIISLRLKEMYQMITMGGNAELELVDSLDPFSEGILFSVMPPKKSWKNISNLSGGEKTLSSLALVFALHHYKPTPLYVMDEIDAALDFRNVSIVASYIKERTKNAQFIVISLRNNMFELASRLIGVYKVNHMTKSVTVENRDYIARAL